MNKSSSKYFNTAALMDEAFIELLEKKDFAYITVKEICAKAGVNRSTFYLHYETIDDLLHESFKHIIKQFVDYMCEDTKSFLDKLNDCPIDELYLVSPKYLVPYLTFIKEHKRIYKTMLSHSSVFETKDAYKDLYKYVFMPILDRFDVDKDKREYIIRFYIDGLMGIVNQWLENDCYDDINDAVLAMQYCTKSL